MFIKLNKDETADKSRAKTAQVLVSHCTELQTEEGLSHRALFSAWISHLLRSGNAIGAYLRIHCSQGLHALGKMLLKEAPP